MTFLQPALLLGLPAILLPILIHLLNRLRFKSVRWAAMMFLVSAARSSTRHARLRHYLILLFRTLIILFLILALSRPVIGGWLGSSLSGAPDTVLIMLDRSASMEDTDPRLQSPKREHAIQRFVQAGESMQGQSRYVLIENALNMPQEIAGTAALPALSLTGPTDTAADLPTMLSAALDYMDYNQTGHTEIWLASDLQASNWHPDEGVWTELGERLAAHPMDVKVRVLALTSETQENTSIALSSLKRQSVSGRPHLNLSVSLQRNPEANQRFPVTMSLNGSRLPEDRKLDLDADLYSRLLALPADQEKTGWGMVEIPADENPRDNTYYFVYDEDVQLHTAIVADNGDAQRYLQLAAAPAPQWFPHSAETLLPSQTTTLNTEALSMLIWQAGTGADDILSTVETFAHSGGAVFCFPPAVGEDGTHEGPFDLRWGAIETAPKASPLRITTWDNKDGPLAESRDGITLPIGQLNIIQRQCPVLTTPEDANSDRLDGDWITLATFGDGKPFLLKKRVGRGSVFVCTTLPTPEWSNMGEGMVLVPMIQRVLQEGGSRLSARGMESCGVWRPTDESEPWVGEEGDRDYRWQAGVYRLGAQRVALNRPERENDLERVPLERLRTLFDGVDLQLFEETVETARKESTSELWPLMVLLALLCMMVESALLISDRMARRKQIIS
jgi:hypothetical protein